MKIKQEIIDVRHESPLKDTHAKGIKKYHISRKGTARLNPWWKHFNSLPNNNIKKVAKFEIEVKRLGEL